MDKALLRKFVSPEIVFGIGARNLAGGYCLKLGAEKVMIVSDPGVIKVGWVADVENSIKEKGLKSVIYSNVSPNPRSEEVMRGAEIFSAEGCDCIVAVGGGSPMDCAKGIGIVSSNQKHISVFEGVDMIEVPSPPLVFIPTTAGTSADVSQFSIITLRDELRKIAIISKAVVPDIALIDPETTITMGDYLTACTGIDAIVHAIEAFVSTASSPLTDIHALQAIRLINEYLPLAIKEPNNLEYRKQVMLGSMEAGLAFSNAVLGAVHAMAHSLGGFLDLPHGECNAILLDHVVDFNFKYAPEKFAIISREFGLNTGGLLQKQIKNTLLDRLKELKRSVGIESTLGAVGVKSSDVPELSKKAIIDPCILTNPRPAEKRDVEVIYEEAL